MHANVVIMFGQKHFIEALDGVPKDKWNQPGVCGSWSVKDIVAHLASYEQVLVDVLKNLLDEAASTPHLDRMKAGWERYNDAEVERRSANSADEVLAELKSAHQLAAALLAQLPEDVHRKTGALPWYGAEYDLEDYITYSFYGHKWEHLAQIMVFCDLLGQSEE